MKTEMGRPFQNKQVLHGSQSFLFCVVDKTLPCSVTPIKMYKYHRLFWKSLLSTTNTATASLYSDVWYSAEFGQYDTCSRMQIFVTQNAIPKRDKSKWLGEGVLAPETVPCSDVLSSPFCLLLPNCCHLGRSLLIWWDLGCKRYEPGKCLRLQH